MQRLNGDGRSGRLAETQLVRAGARGSRLSQRQVADVVALLRAARPELRVEVEIITTTGDRQLETPLPLIGGKGLFTEELEEAILAGSIDLAVHSLKDLPTTHRPGLTIGATPARGPVTDVLICRSGNRLSDLPTSAVIGTSSLRRTAQLLRFRRDLRPVSIRGNVDTRIRKALDPAGEYDAIVLAKAGLERLAIEHYVTEELTLDVMLPAPGQGALAVQCRNEEVSRELLAPVNDRATDLATAAERAFLAGLGGGCSAPVGAYAQVLEGQLRLRGRVTAVNGSEQVDVTIEAAADDRSRAEEAGFALAREALKRGAGSLIGALR